jgi:hypothetical protein
MLQSQQFVIGQSYDSSLVDQKQSNGLSASFSHLNDRMDILNLVDQSAEIKKSIGNRRPVRSWLNLNTGADRLRYHPDMLNSGSKSVLYYANLEWNINWDGFTIFRSDDLKDIEFVSEYKPGRVIVFDSEIPHKATHPSPEACHLRYTYNQVYQ